MKSGLGILKFGMTSPLHLLNQNEMHIQTRLNDAARIGLAIFKTAAIPPSKKVMKHRQLRDTDQIIHSEAISDQEAISSLGFKFIDQRNRIFARPLIPNHNDVKHLM